MCEVAGRGIEKAVELRAPGEPNGDEGALHGWVTCMFSRWDNAAELLFCGVDSRSDPLFKVSTVMGN